MKKIIKTILIITLGALLVNIILILIAPFLIGFGPDAFYEYILVIFYIFPIDGRVSDINPFLSWIVNGYFWSTIIYFTYLFRKKLKNKKILKQR